MAIPGIPFSVSAFNPRKHAAMSTAAAVNQAAVNKVIRLPKRSEVAVGDTWDLSDLFADDAGWETAFKELESLIPGYAKYRGELASSAATFRASSV